jgi:hypothetical protein
VAFVESNKKVYPLFSSKGCFIWVLNETRKELRLRDMPPLGLMQKKSRVSQEIVGW